MLRDSTIIMFITVGPMKKLCCFVLLLEPTWMLYRVPRVWAGLWSGGCAFPPVSSRLGPAGDCPCRD